MSRGQNAITKYFSAVAALNCIASLDPTLRVRLRLARCFARTLLAEKTRPLSYAFEELLGETAGSARRLLYDWFFYRYLESRSWTRADTEGARGTFADAGAVGAYLAACPRGIVVATIHLGDYLEGLRQLRVVAPSGKRVFVVRRNQWSAVEEHAFARIAAGLAFAVLRTGERAAVAAIRELRRGSIVVVLYDLPARFGRAVPVRLFDACANVVCGPAELALLAGADLLPIFTHYDASGASCVEAMPVLPARSTRRQSVDVRKARVVALTQRLWSLAEQQIRRYPAQWAHWLWIHELVMRSPQHYGEIGVISRELQNVKRQ